MRLNICYFIDAFYPMVDGVINHLDNIAKILSQEHNVLVIAPKGRKEYNDNFPYQVFRIPIMKVLFTDYDLAMPNLVNKKLTKILDVFKPDVIHVHSPFTLGKYGLMYARKHHIKSFITIHSKYRLDFLLRTKSRLITKIAFNKLVKTTKLADTIISVCPNFKDPFLLDYKFLNSDNLVYVNNATALKVSSVNASDVEAFKNKYDLTNEKILLFVGRIDKIKNLDFIMKALRILNQRNFNFKMLFVGNGPYLKNLLKQTNKYKLNNKILFLGKITNPKYLATIYNSADLFLFPSFYDTSGIVKQEAAIMGVASLMIKGTTASNNIIDNHNGFLSDNSELSYADKIEEILTNDTLLNNVKANLGELVYSWDEVVKELLTLYNEKEK